MPAPYVDLYLEQGSTFYSTINITSEVTSNVINIAGYSFSSQMRKSYYSANAVADIICTIVDAPNGEISLNLPAGNTANIFPGKYYFDVKTTDTSNRTSRLLEGKIIVTPSITR